MRRMETLLDANRALSNDLPKGFLKCDQWLIVGKLLVHASETGTAADIQRATDELLKVVESEGWMSRAPRRRALKRVAIYVVVQGLGIRCSAVTQQQRHLGLH